MNISMPEPMRQFIEAQALAGNYSASEYVRHLIRVDQQQHEAKIDRFFAENREEIASLLAISAHELDAGKGIAWDKKKFARRRKRPSKTNPS